MPRNGSGVYSAPAGTTAITQTTIDSTRYNALVADLVTDANTARPVVAGGTGATSAAAALVNLGAAAAFETVAAAKANTTWVDGRTYNVAGVNYTWTNSSIATAIAFGDPRYLAPDSDATGASGGLVVTGSINTSWAPGQWGSITGSLYNGAFSHEWTRTGGYGTYGFGLLQLLVTDATPSGEFDVASTAWNTHTNLTGGSVFGGWDGANSPRQGQTFTGGAVVGREINSGNRWGDNGLKADLTGTRDFVGVKLVPDVAPTKDALHYETVSSITIASPGVLTRTAHGYYNGMRLRIYALTGTLPTGLTNGSQYYVVNATTDTFQLSATFGGTAINTTGSFTSGVAVLPSYPGDFALNVGKSIWGHQWHTGWLNSVDSIVPGGTIARLRGGTTAGQAPGNGIVMDGHVSTGVNLSAGTYTNNNAVYLGAGHNVRWDGDARLNSTSGTMGITTGNADADGGLYSNGYAVQNILWDGTGGVPRLRFFGAGIPVAKPTVTGSRGSNAALQSLCAALAQLGLITDSTS